MSLTITHTSEDGTMLEGSRKGDGAWDAIKAAQAKYEIRGWRFMPSIRAIAVSHSRDRAPALGNIERTAEVLRAAGFEVTVDVDGKPRDMEQVEADRAARLDDRAAALHDKAERKGAEADARWAAADAISDGIPMGQPVLVGHHSERGHRAALKQMDGHMRKSVEAAAEAKHAAQRAVTAEHHMECRNNPRRVARRIEKLQADRRRDQRALDGHTRNFRRNDGTIYTTDVTPPATGLYREQVQLRIEHLDVQIEYWERALAEAKASGAVNIPEPAAIQKGWWVKSWAGWRQVARVNKVSVSVWDSWNGDATENDKGRFTRIIKLTEIGEVRETRWPVVAEPVELDDAPADDQPVEQPAQDAPETGPSAPTPARHPSGLSLEAVAVLATVAATERSVHLAGVPESRDVFAEVDAWLRHQRGFGGYDRQFRAWCYGQDPRPAIAALAGEQPLPPASAEQDKRLAYFATPDVTAKLMASELGVVGTGRVLEPSAGDGALARAVRWFNPEAHLDLVEADAARVALLRRQFGRAAHQTFQEYASERLMDGQFQPYPAVIMNPPFTEPGDRSAWATHFLLAWDLLAIGGRMVAVLPVSYRFHQTKVAEQVRARVEGSRGVVMDLADDTFAGSGTRVRTVLVCATRKS